MCLVTGLIGGVVAAIGAVSAIASTAIGVVSSINQGKQQQAMYNYQAQVAQENAKIAQNNAAEIRQQGIEEERLQRMKTLQNIGSQQTAMAANGIDIAQGNAVDVIEDTAAIGELDALQTRYNYEKKALAYEQQAYGYSNQANLDIISGQNAYSAGKWGAVTSGLNGLSKTADVAYKWYEYGGFNGYTPRTKKVATISGGFDSDGTLYI